MFFLSFLHYFKFHNSFQFFHSFLPSFFSNSFIHSFFCFFPSFFPFATHSHAFRNFTILFSFLRPRFHRVFLSSPSFPNLSNMEYRYFRLLRFIDLSMKGEVGEDKRIRRSEAKENRGRFRLLLRISALFVCPFIDSVTADWSDEVQILSCLQRRTLVCLYSWVQFLPSFQPRLSLFFLHFMLTFSFFLPSFFE